MAVGSVCFFPCCWVSPDPHIKDSFGCFVDKEHFCLSGYIVSLFPLVLFSERASTCFCCCCCQPPHYCLYLLSGASERAQRWKLFFLSLMSLYDRTTPTSHGGRKGRSKRRTCIRYDQLVHEGHDLRLGFSYFLLEMLPAGVLTHTNWITNDYYFEEMKSPPFPPFPPLFPSIHPSIHSSPSYHRDDHFNTQDRRPQFSLARSIIIIIIGRKKSVI